MAVSLMERMLIEAGIQIRPKHGDGGPGSGNFNHGGRPGQVGGSAPGNGSRPVVSGKDISKSYTGATDIKSVIKAQGFDGLPKVVSKEEFDEAVKASSFIAQRTYSASSQEILDAYRDHLYNGEWYVECAVGGAQYGQGMYCAADYSGNLSEGIKTEMGHYRRLGENINATEAREEAFNKVWENSLRDANEIETAFIRDAYFHDATKEQRRLLRKISDEEIDSLSEKYITIAQKADNVRNSVIAPSYTETLTLDPSAKIITHRELNDIRYGNLDISYRAKLVDDIVGGMDLSKSEATFVRYNLNTGVSWEEVDVAAKSLGASGRAEMMKVVESVGNEATKQFNEEYQRRVEASRYYQENYPDNGALAAALGYDAINAEGHGASGSYTVILNRTKTIILRNGEENMDSNGDSTITFQLGKDGVIYAIRNRKVIGWVVTSDSAIGENDNSSEKTLDNSAQSVTIKSQDTSTDGGPGSGNHGHKGVPGQIGGSAPNPSGFGKNKSCTGFRDKAAARRHQRHWKEFGVADNADYEKAAIEFLKQPCGGDIDGYARDDGSFVRFNVSTGEFGIGIPGAEVVTYFKAKYNANTGKSDLNKANEYFNFRKKAEQYEEYDSAEAQMSGMR